MHVAAQTYRQSGGDFWPGPIATDYLAPGYTDTYNDVWVVDKATIDDHMIHWIDAGYMVPVSLTDWPGNGNTANGEAAILAPFFDYNNNELYDPENGDYPIIRGDEAAFFMFNDDAFEHSETLGEKLKIEVHGMAYAYDMPGDSALRKTLFMNYLIINRSDEDYHDMAAGIYTDFDIGYFSDDYVGCDSNLNLYYGYNGDLNDEGAYGFGSHPPAQGIVFLNQNLFSFKYINGDFSVMGYPNATDDYYEYLNGYWQDGEPQSYGGSGYGGALLSNYMFPSSPFDITGWSEFTESNATADRRGLGSFVLPSLNAGDSICIDLALTTAFAYDTLVVDSVYGNMLNRKAVEVLFDRTADVIDFYNTSFDDCAIIYERNPDFTEDVEQLLFSEMKLFPMPAADKINIQLNQQSVSPNMLVVIMNAMGEKAIQFEGLNGDRFSIDITSLTSGMYYIVISSADSIIATGGFVKE